MDKNLKLMTNFKITIAFLFSMSFFFKTYVFGKSNLINSNFFLFNHLIKTDTSDLDVNTKWYWHAPSNHEMCGHQLFLGQIVREEMIGDRYAQILGLTLGRDYILESELPIYRKQGKMYFYEDEIWKLLYDFNAVEGDTIEYYLPQNKYYYAHMLIDFSEIEIPKDPLKLRVDKLDTILTKSNLPIKRMWTSQVRIMFDPADWPRMDFIYDKIGSSVGFLGEVGYLVPAESCGTYGYGLRCYTEKDTTYSFVDYECGLLLNTKTNKINESIILSPNPATTSLIVSIESVDSNRDIEYQIINLSGQIMMQGNIRNGEEIDVSGLHPSLYLLQLNDSNNLVARKKWVKL